MEPASKKRKLAPKMPEPPPSQALPPPPPLPPGFVAHEQLPQKYLPVDGAAPPPQPRDHDFETFARHLQDAAMYIYRQTAKSPYTGVSVLLLRWEEDTSVDQGIAALESVFRGSYHYQTERWNIPTTPNPSIKLGVRIASFLEQARPDHLLIVYYAGHGFVGAENQLYWASNNHEDACKLKWDGVRCLFEDAQSDILLLLDSCAVRDSPTAGSHGVKQAIAAYSPDQEAFEPLPTSFTAALCESLHRLSTGRAFTVQRLYEDIMVWRQQAWDPSRLTNGNKDAPQAPPRTPVFLTLTPGASRAISLAPLPALGQDATAQDGQAAQVKQEDIITPAAAVGLIFDEPRVLVCTTFVGEASPDMQFYNQWLHNPSPIAPKVVVEGMFLGPPTMLIISMPTSIWSIVEHDKVCCYLGNISSSNLTHLYQRLLASPSFPQATAKDVEDGRMLLEARQAATTRRSTQPAQPPIHASNGEAHPPPAASPVVVKENVEDSAEMQEAAEQLKALSHVRHLSDETSARIARQSMQMADSIEQRNEGSRSPKEGSEDVDDDTANISQDVVGASPADGKPRRSLLKLTPKSETRCTLCSHAPFKDSSSLRKHIAAAHTRPFPCAFSFAGCTSTFGSKNEWKRHIASQHLCLSYYRCSACPPSTAEGRGNEFNRKDLFTQHLRRMHAPFAIKKSTTKADAKMLAEWENHVKEMQQSCLVVRRQPPPRSACPRPGCSSVFEGAGSWEEWTEHVGRHLEKGEGDALGVDRLLATWALDEGIIEPKGGPGQYRLTSSSGGGSGDGSGGGNSSFVTDAIAKVEDDDDPSITVATGGA